MIHPILYHKNININMNMIGNEKEVFVFHSGRYDSILYLDNNYISSVNNHNMNLNINGGIIYTLCINNNDIEKIYLNELYIK